MMTEPPIMAAPAALLAGFIGKSKTCFHIQDFEFDAAFELGILRKPSLKRLALWLELKALRRFNLISTISPNMRQKILEKGVEETKTALAPNWANTDMFDPSKGAGKWAK